MVLINEFLLLVLFLLFLAYFCTFFDTLPDQIDLAYSSATYGALILLFSVK